MQPCIVDAAFTNLYAIFTAPRRFFAPFLRRARVELGRDPPTGEPWKDRPNGRVICACHRKDPTVALIIDQHARAAIEQRRARGRDTTLFLHVEYLHTRGWASRVLKVDWKASRPTYRPLDSRTVDDVCIVTEPRIARYIQWRDLTVTAWRLGPFTRLTVLDEPLALLEMCEWERTHPFSAQPAGAGYSIPMAGR